MNEVSYRQRKFIAIHWLCYGYNESSMGPYRRNAPGFMVLPVVRMIFQKRIDDELVEQKNGHQEGAAGIYEPRMPADEKPFHVVFRSVRAAKQHWILREDCGAFAIGQDAGRDTEYQKGKGTGEAGRSLASPPPIGLTQLRRNNRS